MLEGKPIQPLPPTLWNSNSNKNRSGRSQQVIATTEIVSNSPETTSIVSLVWSQMMTVSCKIDPFRGRRINYNSARIRLLWKIPLPSLIDHNNAQSLLWARAALVLRYTEDWSPIIEKTNQKKSFQNVARGGNYKSLAKVMVLHGNAQVTILISPRLLSDGWICSSNVPFTPLSARLVFPRWWLQRLENLSRACPSCHPYLGGL